jgi:hypothetical protein
MRLGNECDLPDRNTDTAADQTPLAYLRERKDAIYENLRDTNFEFKAGKFTQADYDSTRDSMEAEAARILDEIETLKRREARRSPLD